MSIIAEVKSVGKRLRSCLCFLVCTGPALTIAGIATLCLISRTREEAVAAYNSAVYNWTEGIRAEFENLTVSVGPNYLAPTVPSSDLSFDKSGELKTYEPLVYSGRVPANQVGGVNWWIDISNSSFSLGAIKRQRTYTSTYDCGQQCRSENGRNVCTTLTPCSNICAEMNGTTQTTGTNTATCQFQVYLESVCIAVHITSSANWEPATPNIESSGCYYEGGIYNGGNRVNNYLNYNYPAKYNTNNSTTVLMEVRHQQDPYVVASSLTRGTYSFGISFIQKVAIGSTLLIIGAAWTLALICFFKKVVACFQQRFVEQKTHPTNAPNPTVNSAPYDVNPTSFTNNAQPQPYPYPPPPSVPPKHAYPYTPPGQENAPFVTPPTNMSNPYGTQAPLTHWQNYPPGSQPPVYAPYDTAAYQQATPYGAPTTYQQQVPYPAPSPYQQPIPNNSSAQPPQYHLPPLLQPQPGFNRRF